jgi:beta-mannosidase
MEPERWPELDWDRLFAHHACQKEVFDRVVPPADFPTFDAWRAETQAYQASLVQLQVEDLRRLKYAPTGGFCHFCFADGHPAVTWSVLDHERAEKRGYAALRDACRPVLPMIEPRAGLVHVASERCDVLAGAVIEVTGERGRLGRFSGHIAADAVTYVGRVELDGVKEASVTLEHPVLGRVENRYDAVLLASVREEARS